jgi:apolipoprotein N-acyltransferase
MAPLGWIAYIPVFWLIYRVNLGASVFWGALYGYAAYGLFNYWLSVFHPLAGLIVGIIYLVYFALLFPLLKLAVVFFPRRAYILQWLLWLSYEYLRTLGFLGYPYGISGYSQWSLVPVIQIASVFGVWGVSALVVFPSAYLAAALSPPHLGPALAGGISPAGKPGFNAFPVLLRGIKNFFLQNPAPALAWACALGAALIFGFVSQIDYSGLPASRISLIQHNTDPWRGGIAQYRNNFEDLKRLSDEALKDKPDLVVWSETAFVPRIYWHTVYRDDHESYVLVKELLDYLTAQDVPFVIGNDDARREVNEEGKWDRVDYNAVMLFDRGNITGIYRKLRLVPFTEHFPYKKQLPWVYKALEQADTHFWKKGDAAVVFDSGGLKFSSPICFEDTFGYLSREFTKNGAGLIVNLSNDAWSKSLPAQMQHLSMAVFRAVENRRSMVRSTASGQTCGIDPNGKILAMAAPFVKTKLTVDVPLVKVLSLYTKYGDFLPWVFIAASLALLIAGSFSCIIKHMIRR